MPLNTTNELGRGLLQASLGVEATPNTGVAATQLLPVTSLETKSLGVGVIEPAWGSVIANRGPITNLTSGATWKLAMRANAEYIGYLLEAMMGTVVPGASPGYTRTYLAPAASTIAQASKRFLTVYEANTDAVNGYAYRVPGAWVKALKFKTSTNKPLTVEAEGFGVRKENTTLALANTSLTRKAETIFSANGLAIKSAALGSAPVQFWPNAYEFEMSVDSGRGQNLVMGSMEAPSVNPFLEGPWTAITASLLMARNPENKAYYDALIGTTPTAQTANLAFEFTTGSSVLTLQMGGAMITPPSAERGQDNERLKVSWTHYYSSNLAAAFGAILTGGPSTLA